ncbi:hypothetical protein QQM79_20525 [Marinobacteraceae bacterium S3BR75-40.1]
MGEADRYYAALRPGSLPRALKNHGIKNDEGKAMIPAKSSPSARSYAGMWISIGIGLLLTIGAVIAILFSGLGGHGNPQNPIAETILSPGMAVLSLGEAFSGYQGIEVAFFIIAIVANVGIWAMAFRFLLWPIIKGMRQPEE